MLISCDSETQLESFHLYIVEDRTDKDGLFFSLNTIMHEYKIQSLYCLSYIFLHIFISTQSRKLNQAEVKFVFEKLRISADSSLIRQKIGTCIKLYDLRQVSVNKHRFFSSVSFVRKATKPSDSKHNFDIKPTGK